MKFTHLFNNTCTQTNTTSFWPSCSQHPKTLSFRSIRCNEGIYAGRVSNFSYNNDSKEKPLIEDMLEDDECVEKTERVIRGLKSDRLFFEPEETNSILGETKKSLNLNGYHSNVENTTTLMPLESLDPCLDFKKSMDEMVEAYGVKGWHWLQELLACYLKVNEKGNHGFIIGAFVDLLVGLDLDALELLNCSSFVASSSSPMTFSSDISIN